MNRTWIITVAGLSLCLLLTLLLPVPFNRIAADDYCYIQKAQYLGFWGSQFDFYSRWTGRFVATFHQVMVGLLVVKDGKLGLYSAVSFGALFISVWYMLRPLSSGAGVVIGLFTFSALFFLTPNPAETWFWLAGAATYLWPGAFLFFALGILLRARGGVFSVVTLGLLLALATASNETAGAILVVLSISWLGAKIWTKDAQPRRNMQKWPFIIAGAAAVLFTFLAVLLAPGNAARAGNFSGPPLEFLLIRNVYITKEFISGIVAPKALFLIASIVILANLADPRRFVKISVRTESLWLSLVLCTLALAYIYCLPATSLFGGLPPDRGHFTFYLFIIPIVVIAALNVRTLVTESRFRYHLLGLAVAYVGFVSVDRLIESERKVVSAKAYAHVFDANQAVLTESANTAQLVILQALPPSGPLHFTDISRDPEHWENQCIADTFHISGGVIRL